MSPPWRTWVWSKSKISLCQSPHRYSRLRGLLEYREGGSGDGRIVNESCMLTIHVGREVMEGIVKGYWAIMSLQLFNCFGVLRRASNLSQEVNFI